MMDNTKKKIDALDERSDQVREILGKSPNWVIRCGITVIFIILSLLLLSAALISYNDIIPAQIVITSKNPPVYLKANTTGSLTNIFVKLGQSVDKDGKLAEIENTAVTEDVYYLKGKTKDFKLQLISLDSLKFLFPPYLNLGDFQLSYSNFIAQYQNYILFGSSSTNRKASIVTWQQLEMAYQKLKNELLQWEKNYILKSPVDGKVTVFDIWNKHQNVSVGETIFTIVPNNFEEIIGRITLPIQNSGKVKVGQKVIIKLINYPFQEWGSLEGKIVSISEVPKQGQDAFYALYIEIKDLTTSYNKQIDFKQEMLGNAEIIAEELTVLERIFYQLRKTFNLS